MGYLSYGRHALRHIVRNANPQSSSQGVVNPLLYACQGLRYRKLEVILTTVNSIFVSCFIFFSCFCIQFLKLICVLFLGLGVASAILEHR